MTEVIRYETENNGSVFAYDCYLPGEEKPFGFVVAEKGNRAGGSKIASMRQLKYYMATEQKTFLGSLGGDVEYQARLNSRNGAADARMQYDNERAAILEINTRLAAHPEYKDSFLVYSVDEKDPSHFHAEGIPFLEHIDTFGEFLVESPTKYIDDKRSLTPAEKRLLFLTVLEKGLRDMQALYNLGFAHGDIIHNIFISMQDMRIVRIGDFATAKDVGNGLTEAKSDETQDLIKRLYQRISKFFGSHDYLMQGLDIIKNQHIVAEDIMKLHTLVVDQLAIAYEAMRSDRRDGLSDEEIFDEVNKNAFRIFIGQQLRRLPAVFDVLKQFSPAQVQSILEGISTVQARVLAEEGNS